MKSVSELKQAVRLGLQRIREEPGLLEGLIYASANRRCVGRIVYTSHLPCNGLEELKSDEDFGVSVELWFKRGGRTLLGTGHEPNGLSRAAVESAIEKAKRDAIYDKEFAGFLKPDELERAHASGKPLGCDRRLLALSELKEAQLLARMSWETIAGAYDCISDYATSENLSPRDLGFILNGDTFIISERMAMGTTTGITASEETSVVLAFLTAMLEKERAKGSAWEARTKLKQFSAYEVGRRAAVAAIKGVGGQHIPSGRYRVIFGPQAVCELLGNLLLPHLTLKMVDAGATIFLGKYGQEVASPLLNVYDDPTLPNGPGSKRVSCEGSPTRKTALIDRGRLVGYLSDSRTSNTVLKRIRESRRSLGVDPRRIRPALFPRNGFRFSRGGGRIAAAAVDTYATNLVIDTAKPLSPDRLLKTVDNGLYIGRLWYTYPVGGYASGIISGTAIADSYLIRKGKLARPILPNSLRLEDDLSQLIRNIVGIANNKTPTILWASDEITYAPWVAISNVNFVSINEDAVLPR